MIIKIAGTNGSGKSWVVRQIMGLFTHSPIKIPGIKKQPIGYNYQEPGHGVIRIVGHYEVQNGGCDTIKDIQINFDEAESSALLGHGVLMEELFVGKEVSRTVSLSKRQPVLCIFLNTTVEDCIRNVEARRRTIGKEPQTNNDQLRAKYKEVQSAFNRLRDAGVNCVKLSSSEAVTRIRKELHMNDFFLAQNGE